MRERPMLIWDLHTGQNPLSLDPFVVPSGPINTSDTLFTPHISPRHQHKIVHLYSSNLEGYPEDVYTPPDDTDHTHTLEQSRTTTLSDRSLYFTLVSSTLK